jgi:hypothetical protein
MSDVKRSRIRRRVQASRSSKSCSLSSASNRHPLRSCVTQMVLIWLRESVRRGPVPRPRAPHRHQPHWTAYPDCGLTSTDADTAVGQLCLDSAAPASPPPHPYTVGDGAGGPWPVRRVQMSRNPPVSGSSRPTKVGDASANGAGCVAVLQRRHQSASQLPRRRAGAGGSRPAGHRGEAVGTKSRILPGSGDNDRAKDEPPGSTRPIRPGSCPRSGCSGPGRRP